MAKKRSFLFFIMEIFKYTWSKENSIANPQVPIIQLQQFETQDQDSVMYTPSRLPSSLEDFEDIPDILFSS